jgi:hypothetical protein
MRWPTRIPSRADALLTVRSTGIVDRWHIGSARLLRRLNRNAAAIAPPAFPRPAQDASPSAAQSPAQSRPLPAPWPSQWPTPCDRTCRPPPPASPATRRIGLHFGNQVEADLIGGHGGHFGMKHVPARHHVRFHARVARNTRAMCSACAPPMVAVASSQCSAIQRRLVIALSTTHQLVLESIPSAQTLRGTLDASPSCCLLLELPWLNGPLLLLGGLLCGCLLRGCLLSCFLSCHFAYSPFSMVCIDPAI